MQRTNKALAIFMAAIIIMSVFTAAFPAVYAESAIPVPVIGSVTGTGGTLTVSWDAVADVSGYKLYRSDTGEQGSFAEITDIAQGENTAFTYADSGLVCGRTYYYCLAAYSIEGETVAVGDMSAAAAGTSALGKPTLVSAKSVGYSSVKLAWKAVSGAQGYVVYRSETGLSGSWKRLVTTMDSSVLSYTATGLTCGTKYYFMVKAHVVVDNMYVYSPISNLLTATPTLGVPAVSAKMLSCTGVTVKWGAVSGATGYAVYRSATGKSGSWSRIYTAKSSVTSYTDSSVTIGSAYYYAVKAYRTVNGKNIYGALSAAVAIKVIPPTPSVSVKNASYKSVTVKWGAISGATGYAVYRSATGKSGSWSRIYTAKSSVLTYTDTAVTAGSAYYYAVKAYRTVNGKNIYGYLSAAVPIKVVPAAPVLSTAKATSCHNASLSWKKVADASGYAVYRSETGKDGSWTRVGTVKGAGKLKYTASGLIGSKTYYYSVAAYRTVNGKNHYSKISNILTVKTYSAYTVLKNWLIKNGTKSEDDGSYMITGKSSNSSNATQYIMMYTTLDRSIAIAAVTKPSTQPEFFALGFTSVSTKYEFVYIDYTTWDMAVGMLSAPQLGNGKYSVSFSEYEGDSGKKSAREKASTAVLSDTMRWAKGVFDQKKIGVNLKDFRFDSLA